MININDAEKLNLFADELTGKVEFKENSCSIKNVISMRDIIKSLKKLLTYYIVEGIEDNNIDFARGRLAGITETFEIFIAHTEFLNSRAENMKAVISELNNYFKTSRVGSEIIGCLQADIGIQHKELAKRLDIDASTLTYHISVLEKTGIINVEKISKYKFYYLSELGKEYKKTFEPENEEIRELKSELQAERVKNRLFNLYRRQYLNEGGAYNKIIYIEAPRANDNIWETVKLTGLTAKGLNEKIYRTGTSKIFN